MEKELTFEEVLQHMRILGGNVGVENNILNLTKTQKILETNTLLKQKYYQPQII